VLNENRPVASDTRERVMRAARELNYSIDQRARALRRQESGTLGLIVAEVANPFFAEVISAIEKVAYRTNRDLFLCNSNEDPEREQFHIQAMAAQRIGGVIILPVTTSGSEFTPLLTSHIPIVCLDRKVDDVRLDAALVDNREGGRIAAKTLLEKGHRDVAIVSGLASSPAIERERGFLAELERAGVSVSPQFIRHGDNKIGGGYSEMLSLLSMPRRPTAVFVINHPMALGALRAVRDLSLKVPADVSLIAFDDTAWAPLLDPALTVVSQPTEGLGTAAAEMLIDRVERRYEGPARTIVLKPTIVQRDSLAQLTSVPQPLSTKI
jgi:DNA-binding LacI/PurR family transcriptional regulator